MSKARPAEGRRYIDIALYAYTHVAHEGLIELGDYPAIKRWLKLVSKQPNYVSMDE